MSTKPPIEGTGEPPVPKVPNAETRAAMAEAEEMIRKRRMPFTSGMDRSDGIALLGVALVSLAGADFAISYANFPYFSGISLGRLSGVAAGWALATYGPIVAAVLFWKRAKQSTLPWLFHALLLPVFYCLLLVGSKIMLSMLNVSDFDDSLGAPIMPALFCVMAVTIIYFSALATRQALRWSGGFKGR
ncbi:hypothetical protein [Nitrospirillum amazonense]|uniref:hypothetical protein n=1 Tax=Nitrospirillum amazonense TaxID=28077 RepID=UPI0011A64E1F|nr:hypothetical protein [Nitrospirillum amazonense]